MHKELLSLALALFLMPSKSARVHDMNERSQVLHYRTSPPADIGIKIAHFPIARPTPFISPASVAFSAAISTKIVSVVVIMPARAVGAGRKINI